MSKRKNFEVLVPATLTTSVDGVTTNQQSVTSSFAKETTSGTSRRKPAGWIPPTRYSFSREVFRVRNGTKTVVRQSDGRRTVYSGPVGSAGTQGSDANRWNSVLQETWLDVPLALRDKALIKARSKMKQGDVNLGIAFAERNRTARLVADTATSITRSLRALRRGNWRGAWNALGSSRRDQPRGRTIPQKWLEMQYGWKPLLSDVYGSVDALSRHPADNWIVTGTGIESEEVKRSKDGTVSSDICDVDVEAMRGVFCRIDAIPQNDLLMAFSSLGVTNPLQVVWELVPFSFMVDWFLPIGSYLESLDAMLGYGDAYYSESRFAKGNWKVTSRNGVWNKNDVTWACTVGTKEVVRLSRTVSDSVPVPTMPRLRDGRSLTRMANALSILATNMR